ncbi:Synaptic vesicle 2-related protein (SV2-related protein) [Durusdinium trenchii]|uniref:Synaptic vesicle 2-related protein (SV2-related protein) n=1 Tax=Durusdinium trenchii TaxID=1381693 RepID=A0ABP0KGE8_9DINO
MASPAASASQDKPTLGEVVDQIGLGPAQMRSGILGGGVWMADGAELLLIGSVADVLSREWELSRFLKGFVVTIVYTGLMVGNISSGPAGARLGRREVIVCSYAGIFLFSILSSTAGGIGVLLLWRFIVGWSIGFGQPAWLAINAEITPSKYRVVTGGLGQALFTVGELYAALLLQMDDPSLKHLDWRRIIQLGALPSLTLLCFCWPFLHQSPTFLQLKGRHAEAVEVLESMKQDNGALDVSVDFRLAPPPPPEGFLQVMGRQAKVIMSNRLWVPTIAVTYSCFIINLSYYGSLYAFPQVLSSLIDSGAAQQLFIGALWEFPGILVGCVLGMMYPRLTSAKFYLVLLATVLLLFIIGGNNRDKHWAFDICLYCGYYGIKMTPLIGFVIIYQVANEIYPAEARTLGCGLCLAGGRLAAMLGPLVFEGITALTGTWLSFFLLMAAGAVLNLWISDFVPETAHLVLDDSDGESKEN